MNEEREPSLSSQSSSSGEPAAAEHDPLLDAMLRWHVQDQLGAQVGGARERFERFIASGQRSSSSASSSSRTLALPPPRQRASGAGGNARSPSFWSMAMLGGALAAAITVVSLRHVLLPIDQRTTRNGRATTAERPSDGTTTIRQATNETPILQDSAFQTIDQGVVRLDDGSPARRMLQRRQDTYRYFDRKKNATVEYVVPREETLYVGLNKY